MPIAYWFCSLVILNHTKFLSFELAELGKTEPRTSRNSILWHRLSSKSWWILQKKAWTSNIVWPSKNGLTGGTQDNIWRNWTILNLTYSSKSEPRTLKKTPNFELSKKVQTNTKLYTKQKSQLFFAKLLIVVIS